MLTSNTGSSRRLLTIVLVSAVAALAVAGSAAGDLSAHTGPVAKTSAQNFEESLRMRITANHGNRSTAKGQASGTVDANGSLNIRLITGSKARANFFAHNSDGTLSGTIAARYRVNGAISSYNGKITSLTGTGSYAHASSLGITFSGTVNRRSHKVKGTLTGRWNA